LESRNNMTVTLNLKPEVEAEIAQKAAERKGEAE